MLGNELRKMLSEIKSPVNTGDLIYQQFSTSVSSLELIDRDASRTVLFLLGFSFHEVPLPWHVRVESELHKKLKSREP